jgi:energy-coupling factor transport system permease protein
LGVPAGDGLAATPSATQAVNARAAAAWSAACLTIVLTTTNPGYRLEMLAVTATVLLVSAGARRSRRALLAAGVAGLLSAAFNFVLSHLGADVLFSLPESLPAIGGPYTVEAAVFGLAAGVTLAAAVLAVAPLAVLIEPDQVVDALPGFLHGSGAAVAAALNLVPSLGGTFRAVSEAQRLRGWSPRGPRSWAEVVVPVVLTAIEDSIQLAESMAARGFGSGPRTRLEPPQMAVPDWLTVAVAVAGAGVFVACVLAGVVAEWDAYPTLRLPPLAPLPAAACLLPALPAVWWRSPRLPV